MIHKVDGPSRYRGEAHAPTSSSSRSRPFKPVKSSAPQAAGTLPCCRDHLRSYCTADTFLRLLSPILLTRPTTTGQSESVPRASHLRQRCDPICASASVSPLMPLQNEMRVQYLQGSGSRGISKNDISPVATYQRGSHPTVYVPHDSLRSSPELCFCHDPRS